MSKFPESVDPDEQQKLVEKLTMDDSDYRFLQFVRRHMKYILTEEDMKREDPPNDEE